MNILYWTPLFWPEIGGMEVQAMKTLPRIQERGHELLVVASHGRTEQPDLTRHDGIPVFRFSFWKALVEHDLRAVHRIAGDICRLIQDFSPDLLHVNFSGYTAYYQLMIMKSRPLPLVIRLATGLVDCQAGTDSVLSRLLRRADWIAAVSAATLAEARQVVPEIAGRSSVIYTGLEPPPVGPLPLPFERPRIVCLGRLAREKGFDLIIEAMARLVRRYPLLSLTIAGDGSERSQLERQAADLGLSGTVTFIGPVDTGQVPDVLNAATIVVIPSRFRDPFPLVALEAAQMARPIVAARIGGIPESVVHGETGLLVESENPAALAEAIVSLLDHPEKAAAMGQAGRQRALEHFGFQRYVAEYDQLYRDVRRPFEAHDGGPEG